MEVFYTSDFSISAYLRSIDFKITDIKREGRKVYFGFSNTPELKKSIEDFDSGVPKEIKRFIAAQSELKSIIYDRDF